jgi:hypothetical protein
MFKLEPTNFTSLFSHTSAIYVGAGLLGQDNQLMHKAKPSHIPMYQASSWPHQGTWSRESMDLHTGNYDFDFTLVVIGLKIYEDSCLLGHVFHVKALLGLLLMLHILFLSILAAEAPD